MQYWQDVRQSAVQRNWITTDSVTIQSIWHNLCSCLFAFWKISTANLRLLWRQLRKSK